ncbi:hypothetical protein PLICRDRAFT_40939 [Plicaturopsis crispa FD-325 SS-3]|nr:hypothetical protein PLICRDRAFT_40939 [Plicaturopsis crispa FD-325 SS-3]
MPLLWRTPPGGLLRPLLRPRQCSCARNQPRKPASWDFVPGRASPLGALHDEYVSCGEGGDSAVAV